MKRDKARKWTDKQLAKMERQLKKIYSQAKREAKKAWKAYLSEMKPEIADLEYELTAAQRAGATKEIERLKKDLIDRKKELTVMTTRYNAMIKDFSWQISNVNQNAIAYLNGETPKIYVVNFNQMSEIADGLGVSFNLVNENTVANLIKTGDIKLPKRIMDIPKDLRWNTRQLNSAVLQGILQGDSINKIADRVAVVIGNNETAALRNARTMVTGAENKGIMDSMREMEKKGVKMKKRWMATSDGRTRDWHASMDGQTQELDDYFIDGKGNELEFPGDSSAPGETVYNCRCCMERVVVGFENGETI